MPKYFFGLYSISGHRRVHCEPFQSPNLLSFKLGADFVYLSVGYSKIHARIVSHLNYLFK